jgi:hypothetical protein
MRKNFELLVGLILVDIILHVSRLASIALFRCVSAVPNLVSSADRFSIAM